MRRFVVVAGSGCAATGIVRALIGAAHDVHVVDRHPPRPDRKQLLAVGRRA